MSDKEAPSTAAAITISVTPSDEQTVDSVRARSYRSYLRRAHAGPVAVGDEWAEFVSTGCGTTRDITLQVVAVKGGQRVGESTDVAVVTETSE